MEGTRLLRGKTCPRETPQAQMAPRRLQDRPRKASTWSEDHVPFDLRNLLPLVDKLKRSIQRALFSLFFLYN
ncbi:hypothetical protein [Peribacillus frigoritolerans]|uniref:hypothetical protein n=1 Tax=Peribacillus frigoritolerans TaxID=450367 RepID=UPI0020BF85D4|nr:hypothetical protein [Peribacillus frigoritolerans]